MAAVVIAANYHQFLGARVAESLSVPFHAPMIDAFADGELRVDLAAEVRNCTVVLIQSTCTPVNDNLFSLALLADAARAAGARRIVAVIPYFGYARQDRREAPGQARSAQVAIQLLESAGIDHAITIDLHSPALETAFRIPLTNIPATQVFAPVLEACQGKDLVVVSPDAGGVKRAQQFAALLGARLAIVTKRRDAPDTATATAVLGDVARRQCLIVDDMASTGRTILGAAAALLKAGAEQVDALFTHAVLPGDARARLLDSSLRQFITSDTVTVAAEERLRVHSIVPALTRELKQLVDR
jgi:ribose-phosphate pyrophosphokinase